MLSLARDRARGAILRSRFRAAPLDLHGEALNDDLVDDVGPGWPASSSSGWPALQLAWPHA